MSSAASIIRDCITACARAKDERGRWRPELQCATDLWKQDVLRRPFGWPVDAECAAAARRIGAWLAAHGIKEKP